MKKINILGMDHLDMSQDFFDNFENEEELIEYFSNENHLDSLKDIITSYVREQSGYYRITRVITKQMRYRVLSEQKWRCNNCGCVLKFSIHSNWEGVIANIDHIHPFADRNTYINGEHNINERSNLQGLCKPCNDFKRKNKD